MKSRILRLFTLLAGFVLVVVVLFAISRGSGFASPSSSENKPGIDPGGGNISTSTISLLSSSDSQPWTRERMLAAQPYPLEPIDSDPQVSLQLKQAQGEPGFISGSPPSINQLDIPVQQEINSLTQATASGYSYPAPFVQYQNFDSYQVYPYSTVGTLFFTQYGVDYRCTAASIGNSAIWTAGHCIHRGDNSQDGWSYNVVFVPAYKNGSTPYGVWSTSHITTKVSWFEFGDLRYDMAGALLNQWNNQTISEVVGSLGFAYNQDSSLHWMNIGYPSAPPFDGKTQQICAASFAYADMSMPDPSPIAMGCDMTKGSSGGPWILGFSGQVGQTNFLNGNNSYRYTFHPQEMYSPYFGVGAKLLYDELLAGPAN
jgi:V8-like Glu-specific endopeptidase